MAEMKDIGKLTERARNATRGIRRTETTRVQASLLLRMADIIEPLADLLDQHDVDMDGRLRALRAASLSANISDTRLSIASDESHSPLSSS